MPENHEYQNRTPEHICLLCQIAGQKATATNSHFTPMGMIKTNTGKRWREETYTIGPDNKIESFFGRDNLKNTDTEIRPDPSSADYIFCQKCEGLLASVLEAPILHNLNQELRNPNKGQNFPQTSVSNNVSYKECQNVESLRFKAFIYSIIWRQCIQQKVYGIGVDILQPDEEEYLRHVVKSALYDGIDGNKKIIDCYPFTIITSENIHTLKTPEGLPVTSKSLIGPHLNRNYPSVFCMNEYVTLLYTEGYDQTLINDNFFGLPTDVFSDVSLNEDENLIKVTFITDADFENFQDATWSERYKLWRRNELIDDFHHAYYLEYKSIIPDEFELIINEQIHQFILAGLKDFLKRVEFSEFDGLASTLFSFSLMRISHRILGNFGQGYVCYLGRDDKNGLGIDICLAIRKVR